MNMLHDTNTRAKSHRKDCWGQVRRPISIYTKPSPTNFPLKGQEGIPLGRKLEQIEAANQIIPAQGDNFVVLQQDWGEGWGTAQGFDVSCNDLHNSIWPPQVHDQALSHPPILKHLTCLFNTKQPILNWYTSQTDDLRCGRQDPPLIQGSCQRFPVTSLDPNLRPRDHLWEFLLSKNTRAGIHQSLSNWAFAHIKDVNCPSKAFGWKTRHHPIQL